ncbi:bifunctional 2-keto-4-hydroxyglutarate aldolase/2-keto-3-deoxy-6-phosphogluconate aldolase [Amphibacillus cookii]|uniref:bifunctional 2-keto-4-hydroxyglutarate aldolase/2-keto-3-deoxy-6-phosphogluconate aldolase n=1 Tax=Amphibacillus cookii TaxID=767787 RepID=UPI001956CCB7|nr:bifunctional 2-keto-4-hydroxyglutarate aldolase/2-keto-3-deoxy-6-phosphogluconate aldolase [Amphibacillus cookii]MBM7541100.1 2-dehydro-3-deoxyphosphogluconate aldolase/(4S)-4-hydroxy-2-oxoglutarate aldolase [Amphibacillus cookii]
MQKYEILRAIHQNYLVAVIRGDTNFEAVQIAEKAYEGGIFTLEITFSTPQADQVIKELSTWSDERVIVGAGTVLDAETARIAILNGAKYVVSPHLDPAIATICNRYSIPYLPGCGSVTEIVTALSVGVDIVKLFPGSLFGPAFINDIKGPIPNAELMPSGGVNITNLKEWFNRGAFAVGIGSALTKQVKESGYESISEVSKAFTQELARIRGG